MANPQHDTKTALVLAAGELFAEHGFEGTSVRAIAEKAGANVAAINYHFGSKEGLYLQTLLHVVHCDTGRPMLAAVAGERSSVEEVAAAIRQAALDTFAKLSSPDRPQWRFRLLMRALFEPSMGRLGPIIDETFRPDVANLMALARRVRPELSDRAATLWAFSFMGQVAFYVFLREPALRVLGREEYDPAFLAEAAEHVARVMMASLAAPASE